MPVVSSLVGKLQKGLDAKYANEKGMVDVYFTHVSNDSNYMANEIHTYNLYYIYVCVYSVPMCTVRSC